MNNSQYFFGLNVGGHDSSIAVVAIESGKINDIEIHLSERLIKVKHQGGFPLRALKNLKQHQAEIWNKIPSDHIAINSFFHHPQEIESNFLSSELNAIELFGLHKALLSHNPDISFFTHHLCHAYSILAQCPFSKAIIIVSDGSGSKTSHFTELNPERKLITQVEKDQFEFFSVYLQNDGVITPISKKCFTSYPTLEERFATGPTYGKLFEKISKLIFGDWTHAGKVMGLSAYGEAKEIDDPEVFISEVTNLKWESTYGKKAFDNQDLTQYQSKADAAASVQTYFESNMMVELRELRNLYPEYDNLILVGGCALNGLLNARILREKIFSKVFVPPFPNDEGISLGCALALAYKKNSVQFKTVPYENLNPYLGNSLHVPEANYHKLENLFQDFRLRKSGNICKEVADILSKGEIVAWMQGRSEVGPRALGNRSILVRPDIPGMKEKLNQEVKFRENFRPYGATILYEHAHNFLAVDPGYQSPFMTFCPNVREEKRSLLRAVTHVDGTCRIQTLMEDQNPRFHSLISEFYNLTGLPVLLNTSLNIMNQPILESIEDALIFFKSSNVRYLIYGDYIISKP